MFNYSFINIFWNGKFMFSDSSSSWGLQMTMLPSSSATNLQILLVILIEYSFFICNVIVNLTPFPFKDTIIVASWRFGCFSLNVINRLFLWAASCLTPTGCISRRGFLPACRCKKKALGALLIKHLVPTSYTFRKSSDVHLSKDSCGVYHTEILLQLLWFCPDSLGDQPRPNSDAEAFWKSRL